MPNISSSYNPALWLKSMDISSIYASKFRKVDGLVQQRERLTLPDSDFLDLDWIYGMKSTDTVVILLHGLEGSAKRPYILGAAKSYLVQNIDACCVNYRGCSGEPNSSFKTYHSGATADLQAVIDFVLEKKSYKNIILDGFSLGANLSLFYAGTTNIPQQIRAIIAISAPCDLKGCCDRLISTRNLIYSTYFKHSLIKKLYQKLEKYPDLLSLEEIKKIKTLYDFDTVYTTKAHGFANADDYYLQCSSINHLGNISIPTYILNAQNDSFLSESCYPYEQAQKNPMLYLETPKFGGHVAFVDKSIYYSEKQAIAFLKQHQII